MFSHGFGKIRAPEFPDGLSWLNHPPLSLKQWRGKAVLLDIWTYSCANCLRAIPHIQRWHEMYAEKGLMVVGVHTPEFAFEKIPQHVAQAIKDRGITYPVILDPDYKVWNLYGNRWWPRTVLIDGNGVIVYDHIGEGGYAETEMEIQALLTSMGEKNLPAIPLDRSLGSGMCYPTTPEVYLGFVRGRFGNAAGHIVPGEEAAFTDEGSHEEGLVYLHGHFALTNDSVVHTRLLPSATESLSLLYRGFSASLVARGRNHATAVAEVLLDHKPLPQDFFGKDVQEKEGKAIVSIREPRLYELVNAHTYHKGTLTLKTASDALECFALTFSTCKEE